MKFDVQKKVELVIRLTEDEAKWLKGVMQNPIGADTVREEQQIDRQNRETFWHALKDV